ncbi:uncharacterized protein [Palaemon carinicauda]|uniref:uncharacterized protein n=1 Tax=Palaemon carinicauda TaxID=392227 RepID=UPI0035B5A7BC
MPPYNTPKSLVDSSIKALCENISPILQRVDAITKKFNKPLVAVHMNVNPNQDQIEAFLKGVPCKPVDPKIDGLNFYNAGQMIKCSEEITTPFLEYMKELPFEFRNRIFTEVLKSVCYEITSCSYRNDIRETKNLLAVKCFSKMKFMLLVLIKCFVSPKAIYTFDINELTEGYFRMIKECIFDNGKYKNDEYMFEMQQISHWVFASTIISFKSGFSSLTKICMRNLASGALLWNICCYCPNLWHLDISGEMFDLQRYCVYEAAAGEFVDALTSSGKRLFKEADFVEALGGLHGNDGQGHGKFDGTAEGCYFLKTLLLPNYNWEAREEAIMVEEMIKIFETLLYLEEVSGVCLYNVLCKLNESKRYRPLMLKLKKFDGTAGGHRLVGVDPKRLNKVKLSCVEEVVFVANVVMRPSNLQELFPNLKHLTITPYDSRAYTFHSILPHLSNLVSLDVEFLHSLSLENVCELAKQCRSLKNLSITCPALLDELPVAGGIENIAEKYRKVSPFHLRADKEKESDYFSVKYYKEVYTTCDRSTVYSYMEKLNTKVCAYMKYLKVIKESYSSKSKTDGVIPEFSRLSKLQFFGLKYLDKDTLYQIILGAPFLQAFTLVLTLGPHSTIQISNSYIGRLAPHLRRVRDVIIAAEKPNDDYYLELDSESIAYLMHFCQDIRSISRVGDWDITPSEVENINCFMMCENLVLRVH